MQIKVYVLFCLGAGRLKAMQSMVDYNGSIKGKDKMVKCEYCNGTGIKE
ncbi:hypothetical protein [Clostridium perfringens]|nr:hypothetical protein [Clostridium perfringens]